jgi:hypothetical protein
LNIVRNNNYEISSKQKKKKKQNKRKEKQISSIEKEWGIRYPVARSLQKELIVVWEGQHQNNYQWPSNAALKLV